MVAMDTRKDDLRHDLNAALQARKDLGKEYEAELVDSFIARLESRLDAPLPQAPAPAADKVRNRRFTVQILSLVMGIPLTAIAAESAQLAGLVVCWAGIVGINVAGALADRLPQRRGGGWG
ncbi:hypothetical protein GCM10010441_59700 [Kitasatospora paracochleata]